MYVGVLQCRCRRLRSDVAVGLHGALQHRGRTAMNLTITGPLFSGASYIREFDETRLKGQWLRVWNIMRSGHWLTLSEIQTRIHATGNHDSEAAISARLRDFRKEKFGGHTVNRRRRGDPKQGLFEDT
jgi:type II secretory pathway predicted ATPase ExeA